MLAQKCLLNSYQRQTFKPIRNSRPSRAQVNVRAGLFDFLTPKQATVTVDPRAAELVEELVSVSRRTNAGSNVSEGGKENIANLVEELSRYCPRNPLKSRLLWGNWEVLYCSKPTAIAGPLRSGLGQVAFPGLKARQVLEEPNQLTNIVEFKTLGFIPGYARQYGSLRPVSGDSFILSIESGELKTGLGGPQEKEFNVQRQIQILYLDEDIRVARFVPNFDLEDDEAGEDRSQEDILFVFQRLPEVEEEEEEVEVEEEPEEPSGTSFFGFGGRRESLATMAERQVRAQMEREQQQVRSTAPVSIKGPGTQRGSRQVAVAPPTRGTQSRGRPTEDPKTIRAREAEEKRRAAEEARLQKQREQEEKKRAAEEARLEKQREAQARAAELAAAKERAEQEKRERAERQQAIKELVGELQLELREATSAVKEAQKDIRDVEKENAPALKAMSGAQAEVAEAEKSTQDAAQELSDAVTRRKQAEQVVKDSQAALKQAEKEFRQKLMAAGIR